MGLTIGEIKAKLLERGLSEAKINDMTDEQIREYFNNNEGVVGDTFGDRTVNSDLNEIDAGMGALKLLGKTLKAAGAGLLTVLFGATSCSKIEQPPIVHEYNFNNTTNVNADIQFNMNQDELIIYLDQKINEYSASQDAKYKELLEELKAIRNAINDLMAQNEEISEKELAILNKVLEYLEQFNGCVDVNTQVILDAIKDNNGNLDKILDAITTLTEFVKTDSIEKKQLGEQLLQYLAAIGFDMNMRTSELLAAIEKGNVKLDNITELLVQLKQLAEKGFEELGSVGEKLLVETANGNVKLDEVKELITKLETLVANGIEGGKELGNQILQYLAAVGFDMNVGMSKILDAINNVETGGNVNVQVDIEKLAKLIENLTNIVKANGENNEKHALIIEDLLAQILENTDNLDGKADTIIEKLTNITVSGGDVDLTEVTSLLKDIKDATSKNTDFLSSIDSKLNFIGTIVKSIMDNMPQTPDNTKVLELLGKIYDKIPNGCNCKDIDLTEIIAKLEIIIQNQNNPSTNEGILGELEDALG